MCHHSEYHYLKEWERLREREDESDEPTDELVDEEWEDEEHEEPRRWIPGAADD